MQRQPFEALAALLEHAGDVVSREDLRGRIWPAGTFVDFDHSLNTAINKLRHTLCDSVSSPRFVETVPQRGYRFIAPVERLTASRRKFLHPPASAEIGRLRRQRLLLALALLAVLTLCVVAWSNSPASVL